MLHELCSTSWNEKWVHQEGLKQQPTAPNGRSTTELQEKKIPLSFKKKSKKKEMLTNTKLVNHLTSTYVAVLRCVDDDLEQGWGHAVQKVVNTWPLLEAPTGAVLKHTTSKTCFNISEIHSIIIKI